MFKKALIILLSLFCTNAFCMEKNNNNSIQLQQLNTKNTCWLMILPQEIVKEIIKFCLEISKDEYELKKTFLDLPQINKLFRQLMKDEDVLLCGFKNLEEIKKNFYFEKTNLAYDPNYQKPIMIISKANLLSQLTNFAKNKYANKAVAKKQISKDELLIYSAKKGILDLLVLSLCNGANINYKDSNGFTALIAAVVNNDKEIVELLVSKGADIKAKTNLGNTALTLAEKWELKEIVKLLQNLELKQQEKISQQKQ